MTCSNSLCYSTTKCPKPQRTWLIVEILSIVIGLTKKSANLPISAEIATFISNAFKAKQKQMSKAKFHEFQNGGTSVDLLTLCVAAAPCGTVVSYCLPIAYTMLLHTIDRTVRGLMLHCVVWYAADAPWRHGIRVTHFAIIHSLFMIQRLEREAPLILCTYKVLHRERWLALRWSTKQCTTVNVAISTLWWLTISTVMKTDDHWLYFTLTPTPPQKQSFVEGVRCHFNSMYGLLFMRIRVTAQS